MERVTLHGAELEFEVSGSGDPLILIHGAILADAFFPLLNEPEIAENYRVIYYHRRGFAGSDRASHPFLIQQQAADCSALLRHLDIARAHVAGIPMARSPLCRWPLTPQSRFKVWPC